MIVATLWLVVVSPVIRLIVYLVLACVARFAPDWLNYFTQTNIQNQLNDVQLKYNDWMSFFFTLSQEIIQQFSLDVFRMESMNH